MELQKITFELAEKLKEQGFLSNNVLTLPSIHEVADWLIQEMGFCIEISSDFSNGSVGYKYIIYQLEKPLKEYRFPGSAVIKTTYSYDDVKPSYEKALSTGIDKAIEILKTIK